MPSIRSASWKTGRSEARRESTKRNKLSGDQSAKRRWSPPLLSKDVLFPFFLENSSLLEKLEAHQRRSMAEQAPTKLRRPDGWTRRERRSV